MGGVEQNLFSLYFEDHFKKEEKNLFYFSLAVLKLFNIHIYFQLFFYSQFHKTLPKSSLQMHWISVRFYEMGDSRKTMLYYLICWICYPIPHYPIVPRSRTLRPSMIWRRWQNVCRVGQLSSRLSSLAISSLSDNKTSKYIFFYYYAHIRCVTSIS